MQLHSPTNTFPQKWHPRYLLKKTKQKKQSQTFTGSQTLTVNSTATRGFRQEGLPRKRWEGTLVICVEHIFIWAETETHKNPRRGREVICPDSSFTLPRCNTGTNTHKWANVHAWTHINTHSQMHTEMPTHPLPSISREVNRSCHRRNISRECVRMCVWMHKSVNAPSSPARAVFHEKVLLKWFFVTYFLLYQTQTASLWVSGFVSSILVLPCLACLSVAPLHSLKSWAEQMDFTMIFPWCTIYSF